MRFSWIVGIAVLIFSTSIFAIVLLSLGLEIYVDYGRTICDMNDVCRSGHLTAPMCSCYIFSIVLAIGAGRYVAVGVFPFFETYPGQLAYNVWFLYSLLACISGVFLMKIVNEDFASWVVNAVSLLIAYKGCQHYKKYLSQHYAIQASESSEDEDYDD